MTNGSNTIGYIQYHSHTVYALRSGPLDSIAVPAPDTRVLTRFRSAKPRQPTSKTTHPNLILFSAIERAYSIVYTSLTALYLVKGRLCYILNKLASSKWRPPNPVNTATIQLDFISPSSFTSANYLATSLPTYQLAYSPTDHLRYLSTSSAYSTQVTDSILLLSNSRLSYLFIYLFTCLFPPPTQLLCLPPQSLVSW